MFAPMIKNMSPGNDSKGSIRFFSVATLIASHANDAWEADNAGVAVPTCTCVTLSLKAPLFWPFALPLSLITLMHSIVSLSSLARIRFFRQPRE